MTTSAFWRAALERAVKTFAQTLVALMAVGVADLLAFDWPTALSAAGFATVLSLLTSVASNSIGGPGPSITGAEVPVDKPNDLS